MLFFDSSQKPKVLFLRKNGSEHDYMTMNMIYFDCCS